MKAAGLFLILVLLLPFLHCLSAVETEGSEPDSASVTSPAVLEDASKSETGETTEGIITEDVGTNMALTDTSGEPDPFGADSGNSEPETGSPEGLGSWMDPIIISAFPFHYEGNTQNAPAQAADYYSPCAPTTNESGPEFVFQMTVPTNSTLNISLNDIPGDAVDVDVHLLTAATPDHCIARNNISISRPVAAGVYWLTVDTWVNSSGISMAGPFYLSVSLSGGSSGTSPSCLDNPIPWCTETDKTLPNGVPEEESGSEGCPDGMQLIAGTAPSFCIDRYEAMLVMIQDDGYGGEVITEWSPYANPGNNKVSARSVYGVVPQGYINQIQAKAACVEAGKRLCTDNEWLRACKGPDNSTFPYGNTRQPEVCNDSRSCHPAVQYFESTADWIWSEIQHPCINQLPDGLAKTGSYTGCVTEEGVHDMMGNVHEWTADPNGTFRGGYYVDTVINGPGCLYATTAHNVSHWDYSTGFRCCADWQN